MKAEWQTRPLGEVCERVTVGHVGITAPYYRDEGIMFLRTQNVGKLGLDLDDVKYITPEFHASLKKSEVKGGDILMSRVITHTVNCALVPSDLGVANCANVVLVRPGKAVIPEFLTHYIRSPIAQKHLLDRKVGSAQLVVNTTVVKDWPVPFPPLPEQQRIVGILDEAFDGIAKARANAEKNLQNARALFESRLQSVLLSKKWEWKTIGDLCDGVEYGSSAKSKKEGKVPVLRMGNIQDGQLDWGSLVYTDDKDEIARYLLKHNDVLFNRTNSPELVGKTAIYKSEMPAIFAGYLIRIHRKENLLDGDYLNYFLNSQIALDYGKTVVISSVNQANINGAKLKGYPIPAPSILEQKDIVKKLDTLQKETQRLESLYQRKLAALDALKKSLLHQAFSGHL